MIRSKGEAGTGDIVEAVRHMRSITGAMRRLSTLDDAEVATAAKELQAPADLVRHVAREGALPVPLFSAGGIATPADAALMMQLGAEAVFVGAGIFKSEDPARRAAAVVEATTHFRDADRIARASEGLGVAMVSLESRKLDDAQLLAGRGWLAGFGSKEPRTRRPLTNDANMNELEALVDQVSAERARARELWRPGLIAQLRWRWRVQAQRHSCAHVYAMLGE